MACLKIYSKIKLNNQGKRFNILELEHNVNLRVLLSSPE